MSATAPAELAPEQLELAWRQMRRPASWPGTLQEAMADHSRAILIRGYARSLACRLSRPAFNSVASPRHSLPCGPVPPTPNPTAADNATRRAKPPRFDARKAAANDFD